MQLCKKCHFLSEDKNIYNNMCTGCKFKILSKLQIGWNGYSAEPPSEKALAYAKKFVNYLLEENYPPNKIVPLMAGGIGIIFKGKNGRRVYIEFFNNGNVISLYLDGAEIITKRGHGTVERIKNYLKG